MEASATHVPVLIVGGGGCGLSASIFLSELGTRSLLVERHPAPGRLPKARYINQRTMEVYRQFGVADAIYARSMPLKHMSRISWRTSLGGDGPLDRRTFFQIDAFGGGGLSAYAKDSPCSSTLYPQVRLEPLLRDEAAARAPGQVRYNHELVSFSQDQDQVRATIRDRGTDQTYEVSADYLIGADGGKTVGPAMGAVVSGQTDLAETVTVYFRADLSAYWHDDTAMTTWFCNPDGGSWSSGVLGQLGPGPWGRHSREWMFHFTFRPDDPARFDEAALVPRMRALMKIPDLAPEIIAIGHWTVEGVLVDRYRFGRVFLGGDAAHRFPPSGGLGLNTGVQDAHNLAWKIAAVERGWGDPALIDSYENERKPIADVNASQSILNSRNMIPVFDYIAGVDARPGGLDAALGDPAVRDELTRLIEAQSPHFDSFGLQLGFTYGPERDWVDRVSDYRPSIAVGARMPHAWIELAGMRASTLDLLANDRLTLIGGPAAAWIDAIEAPQGVPVDRHVAGRDFRDGDGDWAETSGLADGGALLVRPDGHILAVAASAAEASKLVTGFEFLRTGRMAT